MDFDTLKQQLRTGVVQVTFTKVNGDTRVMDCTLKMDLIPPSSWPVGQAVQEEEQHRRNIRVYDVKAQGWRSFIFDRVSDAVPQ